MEDKREWWIFTFGTGQKHGGFYVRFYGTYGEARTKMVERYGVAWAFQYGAKEWKEWEARAREMGYISERYWEEGSESEEEACGSDC